ncbi:MAG: DegT/DnrJ/EryC1/StrS family aminotransferase [Leptospiraceae bacterium]|nr:DegT/DnrJ/EryC1/StrS family aminotransferase [Leptospiraceae bacterium]MCP5495212.1 DegT/DnrJ/EryC1/StrS family aminotransferase [Leptospiraceae bacterium]
MSTMSIRKTFLPFALPSISEEAIEEVANTLRSGWVTSGPKVKQFESLFADFVNSKEAISLNSATAGLHLCLEAIGLSENDAVITTAVTFTATVEVIGYFKAQPLLTDIDPITNLMTIETIQSLVEKECKVTHGNLIHKKTNKVVKAIIPVHLAGHTCDMEGIIEFAKKYNMYVIEDAAHAFPAIHKGKMIGTWGDFTVFSFYATKGITTGEGGMVTTENHKMAERLRRTRLHGINREVYLRPGWYYEVTDLGFKYNMTDVAAALGVVQLKEANYFWNRRTEIARTYRRELQTIPGLKLPVEDENGAHSWHLYRMEVDPNIARVNREKLVLELHKRNIGTSLHFIPIFEHSYYKNTYNYFKEDYLNSAFMYERILSIPLFAGMTNEDVKDVINAIKDIV